MTKITKIKAKNR